MPMASSLPGAFLRRHRFADMRWRVLARLTACVMITGKEPGVKSPTAVHGEESRRSRTTWQRTLDIRYIK